MTQPRTPSNTRRQRLPADVARNRILEAAAQALIAVGPERLRLTELAAELEISHQAILHHFGSREGLVEAVVERATSQLDERLTAVLSGRERNREKLFEIIADFFGGEGNARLIAWLALSDTTPNPRLGSNNPRPFQPVIELAHAQRTKAHPERSITYSDTEFRSQLAALALLGNAIFGDIVRASSGSAQGPAASRSFRKRLAALLLDED